MPSSSTLQHSPAEILQQVLIDAGVGTDPDLDGEWPVYSLSEVSTPDNLITVRDTTGIGQGRIQPTGEVVTHWGLQVRVRSSEHQAGWRKANEVREYISKTLYDIQVDLDGTAYLVQCASHIGDTLPIGKDTPTTKRSLFTLNFTAPITQFDNPL